MHSYLRTVGFSKVKSRKEMQEIIQDVINTYDEKIAVENHPDGVFVQYSKNYGCDCGITVCGQYDEDNEFHVEYSFPFFRGTGITSQESVVVERHAEKESYAGACDDMRLGVTLIFYLQNPAEYMLEKYKGNVREGQPLTITGLAREGKILFSVQKDKEAVKVERELTKNRNNLIAAARNGDEEAMEDLTMEDMDMYSMISERIVTDDVLTIVDTCFMPHGIECDQYSVMGEIVDFVNFKNILTGEKLCQMTIECNDIQFDVCINCADLLGEPAVGRRFKGLIWLQGQKLSHSRRKEPQILCNDRQPVPAEICLHLPENFDSRPPFPMAELSRGVAVGYGVILIKSPEVVHPHQIIHAKTVLHSPHPPGKSCFPVVFPVIQRVSPQLACG